MNIKIILAFLICICLAGCGITGKNGIDGKDGKDGQNGRDYITPVIRPYIHRPENCMIEFTDVYTATVPKLYYIYYGSTGMNGLVIRVPANNAGKKLQVIINGVKSAEKVIPSNIADYMVFNTQAGTDYDWGHYMNSSKLLKYTKNDYFIWFLDGVQQEFYFMDSFI